MLRREAPLTIAQRVASIEADITALTQQLVGYRSVVEEARSIGYDAGLKREFAELMVSVLEQQIEEQWKAREALVPKQRSASD